MCGGIKRFDGSGQRAPEGQVRSSHQDDFLRAMGIIVPGDDNDPVTIAEKKRQKGVEFESHLQQLRMPRDLGSSGLERMPAAVPPQPASVAGGGDVDSMLGSVADDTTRKSKIKQQPGAHFRVAPGQGVAARPRIFK